MRTNKTLQERDDTNIHEFVGGRNVIQVPGSKKLLLERTQTENSFHTLSTIRKGKGYKQSKNRTSWLLLLMYLAAGLFIGTEIYLYLVKPG